MGFKNEYTLREGFVKELEKVSNKGGTKGYGPSSFPNIVICGKNCIVKNNGMPIGGKLNLDKEFYWPLLITSNQKPFYYLLEIIWTRIAYRYDLDSSMFGDDYQIESFHSFLSCKEYNKNGIMGWDYYYDYLPKERLNNKLEEIEWKPEEINSHEEKIILFLISGEKISLLNKKLITSIEEGKFNFNEEITTLKMKNIIYEDKNEIMLISEEFVLSSYRDGITLIGDNSNGHMMNWIKKNGF